MEVHWLSSKEKVLGIAIQQSVKKVMLTVFLDMKGPIPIDFLEKGATVNNASYGKFTLFTEWPLYIDMN